MGGSMSSAAQGIAKKALNQFSFENRIRVLAEKLNTDAQKTPLGIKKANMARTTIRQGFSPEQIAKSLCADGEALSRKAEASIAAAAGGGKRKKIKSKKKTKRNKPKTKRRKNHTKKNYTKKNRTRKRR